VVNYEVVVKKLPCRYAVHVIMREAPVEKISTVLSEISWNIWYG